MIEIPLPSRGPLVIESLFVDMNGTVTVDGEPVPGVAERCNRLAERLNLYLITAGTFGNTQAVARELGAELIPIASENEANAKYTELTSRADASRSAVIGNGANDARILRSCALGIVVIEAEGAHFAALSAADVVCRSSTEALELLLNPRRLTATLRG